MSSLKADSHAIYSDGISARAGRFLEITYLGAHKDKRIARALGVSPAMAKLLRAGHGWTVARLDQASRQWAEFCQFVWPAPQHLDDRLDRLLQEIDAIKREINNLTTKMGRP